MRTSIPVAGLGALLLAAGAVGCGSEQSPEMTPAAAVAKAAKNTEAITSVRYRMSGASPESGKVKGEASMRLKPTIASTCPAPTPARSWTSRGPRARPSRTRRRSPPSSRAPTT